MQTDSKQPDFRSTRRQFVATAAGAAAGLTLIRPESVRGSTANSRIKVGCIGLGGRGSWIAGLFKEHGGYEIAAVADYFPHVSEKIGTGLGIPKEKCFSGLKGYRRVLDSGVEAMVLKTPPYCFPDHAEAAVEAGCHVYMAKPVAIDVPGCERIRRAGAEATTKNRVFLVDFQLRRDPYLLECVKKIRAGKMGKLEFMRTFYDDEGRADPPLTGKASDRFQQLIWAMDVELGGDRIVCAGIHAVDAMCWIAGELPIAASGIAKVCRKDPHGDATDAYSLTYEFPSGLLANYSGDQFRNFHAFNCGCDVYGWKTYMETRYGGKTWLRGEDWRYAGGEKEDLYPWGAKENIKTFHENIIGGKCDNPTVEPSVHSNLAAILGRDAGRAKRRVTWEETMKEQKAIVPDLSGLVE